MIEISIYEPLTRTTDDIVSGKVRVEFILPRRPFLVQSSYSIGELIQYPKGYGIAYRDWSSDKLIFAPIPFNILIGVLVWSYLWLRVGFARSLWQHRRKDDRIT